MLTQQSRLHQILLAVLLCSFQYNVYADWNDLLNIFKGEQKDSEISTSITALTDTDMIAGLKEALSKGTQTAVQLLGKQDGFLGNSLVKIPMPESLQKIETTLRRLGQDKIADSFIESMNRAAERAVPEATSIFTDSIKSMTIDDARNILQGSDDAATQYFRSTSEDRLRNSFMPIVKQATDSVGVTAKYKALTGNLGMVSGFIDTSKLDVDSYVTDMALDGLFLMIAAEEKKIRENPVARTTDLLKKIFAE